MGGAGFIVAINIFVAGLLAAAFMAIAMYDASRVAARWLGLSYLLGMAYFAIEFSIPAFADARLPVVAAFAVLFGATVAFNGGLAHKYDVRPPWAPPPTA